LGDRVFRSCTLLAYHMLVVPRGMTAMQRPTAAAAAAAAADVSNSDATLLSPAASWAVAGCETMGCVTAVINKARAAAQTNVISVITG